MDDLKDLEQELTARVAEAADLAALETLRVEALGKKGRITQKMKALGGLDPDARRAAGQLARNAGWPNPCICDALGISKQRMYALLREPLPDADAELLLRRIALQDTVRNQLLEAGQRWLTMHLADAGGRTISSR